MDGFIQFSRNERWGVCDLCPRSSTGNAFPEACANTERKDHMLTIDQLTTKYKEASENSLFSNMSPGSFHYYTQEKQTQEKKEVSE